jgi:hypothetical protein
MGQTPFHKKFGGSRRCRVFGFNNKAIEAALKIKKIRMKVHVLFIVMFPLLALIQDLKGYFHAP